MNININNSTSAIEEILSSVGNAVQEFNNGGDKNKFFRTILKAIQLFGIENFVKITKLSRVEIYDTLDGVSPSFENLSRILEAFGVKINLNFDKTSSQLKKFFR